MAWQNENIKKTFQCWSDMKQRCYNKNAQQYHNYGARGISVSARWRKSFLNFLYDMGERPIGMTLDRKDNNGNYTKRNCRWLSNAEQQKNKRTVHIIEFNGESLTRRDWAKRIGRHETTLASRFRQGYPLHMILSPEKFHFGSIKAIAAMKGKQ